MVIGNIIIGFGYMLVVLFITVIYEDVTTMNTLGCVISAFMTPIILYLIGVCVQYII